MSVQMDKEEVSTK